MPETSFHLSFLNLANCPIRLQTGVRDFYDENALRSVRTAGMARTLDAYRAKYGFGYEHEVLVHVPNGHGFPD